MISLSSALDTAGLDYLCVQSYDGLLSIFECESSAFARFLPNFLIPGIVLLLSCVDLSLMVPSSLFPQ